MILLINHFTYNSKKHIWNVALIIALSKVILSKVLLSIVIVSKELSSFQSMQKELVRLFDLYTRDVTANS